MSVPSSEEWRAVPGYEGTYEVSDLGSVRSLPRVIVCRDGQRRPRPGRKLQSFPDKDGYPCVNLGRGNQCRVHRLVLEAFVGPAPEGYEACHGNGDPTDPRLSNLRWDTKSENMLDRVRHGTHPESRKTHCPRGHAYTPENTYMEPGKRKRSCRTCRTELFRAWDQRRRMRAAGLAS